VYNGSFTDIIGSGGLAYSYGLNEYIVVEAHVLAGVAYRTLETIGASEIGTDPMFDAGLSAFYRFGNWGLHLDGSYQRVPTMVWKEGEALYDTPMKFGLGLSRYFNQ